MTSLIEELLAPVEHVSFEKTAAMQHGATWDDVASKAKRLVQEGKVTILRNAPHHVMAHVIGDGTDNGGTPDEHDVEISRHDPASQIIEQWNCFLADAPVTMADGSRRPISEIKVGDLVLTHEGNVRPVLNVWSRYFEGDLARIKLSGISEEVVATHNHRFWAANEDYHHSRRSGWEGKYKSAHHKNRRGGGKVDYVLAVPARGGFKAIPLVPEVGWREAKDLEEAMYLSMTPSLRDEPLFFEDIEIGGDIAWLLGWYVAEGYIIKSDPNRIGFSLGPDEWGIAETLSAICQDAFGTPGTIRKSVTGTDFRVSSSVLRRMVEKLVGTGAYDKSLHVSLMEMPVVEQECLLDGWWCGDGSQDGNRRSLSTVSPNLANQARLMLARLGMDSSVHWEDANFGNGFVKNARRMYIVRWQPERKRKDAERFMLDGSVWMRIECVSLEPFEGEVWDIEVAGDHSFQAYGVNAHNCDCAWSQFAWDRTRKWKRYEGRVCSHVLATYWKARSTPMDLSDMDEGYVAPRGQKTGPGAGQQMMQGMTPDDLKAQQDQQADEQAGGLPDEGETGPMVGQPMQAQPTPEGQPLPSTQDLTVPKQPVSPYNVPKQAPTVPQHEQLHLFDITAPPGMQPTPMAAPVSIPGGAPPSPTNPVQFPGTFSHFLPVLMLNTASLIYAKNALTEAFETLRAASKPIYVKITAPVALEQSGGKIPLPGAMPYGVSSEGIPLYKVMELGWNPATGMRENADVNQLQGAPEQTGVYSDVPAGRRAEVLDWDDSLKMAYVVVPLDYPDGGDVRLHPHCLRGYVSYSDIKLVPDARSPWRSASQDTLQPLLEWQERV